MIPQILYYISGFQIGSSTATNTKGSSTEVQKKFVASIRS